jgi:hypothetical protein
MTAQETDLRKTALLWGEIFTVDNWPTLYLWAEAEAAPDIGIASRP